ncbi:RraA family protein [Fulvivirgaceae bacterium BMA12]|uniref:Putative 4-hydroxy-4-methyl-2-oxoglutarate aldolase n=1 Tax=Agaribacillus aureus TaxID=3051825 RepID=A0ABT8L2Z2_9BACT|nr:RraA family protein [Fulvivirgaceae bacterium BMA12]
MMNSGILSHSDLLKLKRWNTPTIYNGWECITKHDRTKGFFNLEQTHDYMPEMGPMVGYAVTLKIKPSDSSIPKNNPDAWTAYREYMANLEGPKIVIVEDRDKPAIIGSFWGEVNSNIHRSLGCVGTITDGAIRDIDEMVNAGFKALAKGTCVGHAYVCPETWGEEVEVFGCKVSPGDLIHADKHGFLIIPPEDQENLLEAAVFMDSNECNTMIDVARRPQGQSIEEFLKKLDEAGARFRKATKDRFNQSNHHEHDNT